MTTVVPVCAYCQRLHESEQPVGVAKTFTCDSFPEGIPQEILRGENLHNHSLNGEPVFAPRDAQAAQIYMRKVLAQEDSNA